ncbi:MAG: ECF-type sigma factor [Planctomycetota bacterium]|jgi:RNA polymerase sigma factor (TIGR02999 family)
MGGREAHAGDDPGGERTEAVTRLLQSVRAGDPRAADALLTAVYDDLRRLAASRMARERPGHTLEATALVHEAYLRLVGDRSADWESRGHFFAAAAEAMRRILVERARQRGRLRHGGGRRRVALSDEMTAPDPAGTADAEDLIALDHALEELEARCAEHATLVKLRSFAGLTLEQAADAMGVSRATAARQWAYARAWLFDHVRNQDESPNS